VTALTKRRLVDNRQSCPALENWGFVLDYLPCRFLSPTVLMAQYKSISADEHELSPSPGPTQTETLNDPNEPWNDELVNMVSARLRRVFSLLTTCNVILTIFPWFSTKVINLFRAVRLRRSFLPVQCRGESRNRKREKKE